MRLEFGKKIDLGPACIATHALCAHDGHSQKLQ